MKAKPVISVKNLTVSFNGNNNSRAAIQDVTFDVFKNEIIGIVGESGKGKSTLLDIIMGFLKPSSGSILVDGVNLKDNTSPIIALENSNDNLVYVLMPMRV